MIKIIFKVLRWICSCVGAVILGILGCLTMLGDFGNLPQKVMTIAMAVIAIVVFAEIGIGLSKAKTTKPREEN